MRKEMDGREFLWFLLIDPVYILTSCIFLTVHVAPVSICPHAHTHILIFFSSRLPRRHQLENTHSQTFFLSLSLSRTRSITRFSKHSLTSKPLKMVYTISSIRFPAITSVCNRSRSNFNGNRTSNLSLLRKGSFSVNFNRLYSIFLLVLFVCLFAFSISKHCAHGFS